jgi:hypothetical protein
MSEQGEKVVHPSWCDRTQCTAPEFRPTTSVRGHGYGQHQSTPVLLPGSGDGKELLISVTQSVAPWDTGFFLRLGTKDRSLNWMTEFGDPGEAFALFELLAQPVAEQTRKFPRLFGERFGWVKGPQDVEGPAQDVVDEWDTLPGVTDTYPSTSAHDNALHVEEYDVGGPEVQLLVDSKVHMVGTLDEAKAAVAGLVTTLLVANPVSLAEDAGNLNRAFNDGTVFDAVTEHGRWWTLFGVATQQPVRIEVNRR